MATAAPRLLLWIAGLGFLGFGIAFLVAPLAILGALGIDVQGAAAATELRAFYGGLEIGLGLLLIAAARQPRFQEAGLWLCLGSYGAIGLVRGGAMLLAMQASFFLVFALVTELLLAALAAAALRKRH